MKTLDEVLAEDPDFGNALNQAVLVAAYKQKAGELLRDLHTAATLRDEILFILRVRYGISHGGLIKILNDSVQERWKAVRAI